MLISSYAWPELGRTGRRIGCKLMGHSLQCSAKFYHLAEVMQILYKQLAVVGVPHPNSSTSLLASRARFLLRDCFFFTRGCSLRYHTWSALSARRGCKLDRLVHQQMPYLNWSVLPCILCHQLLGSDEVFLCDRLQAVR